MSEIKRMSLEEFVDEGYLQELNRRFLHPLGLALEVVINEQRQATHFGGVWDYRDDPEGIIYGDGMIEPDKAMHIDRLRANRKPARRAVLGYWVQPADAD